MTNEQRDATREETKAASIALRIVIAPVVVGGSPPA